MNLHERALPCCTETTAYYSKQCMTGLLHMITTSSSVFASCNSSKHAHATCALLIWDCRDLHPVAKKIAAVVACLVYMTISSALIVLNQQLMNEDGFRYPMALSGLGMGFSAVASYIACNVSAHACNESARALHPSSILQRTLCELWTLSWRVLHNLCAAHALWTHLAVCPCCMEACLVQTVIHQSR